MNRTVYATDYNTPKSETRSRASRSVNRHLFIRRLRDRVAIGILGSTALLIIFGMLLLILPAFKVHSVKVKGNDRISAESVIEASGVSIGDELLEIHKDDVAERIMQNENVERVSVSTSLSGVTIKIVEKTGTALSSSADASVR